MPCHPQRLGLGMGPATPSVEAEIGSKTEQVHGRAGKGITQYAVRSLAVCRRLSLPPRAALDGWSDRPLIRQRLSSRGDQNRLEYVAVVLRAW